MSVSTKVFDLSWDDLYLEVQKGNVSMDEFLDYMVNTSKESYNEGYEEGYEQCQWDRT